MVFICVHLRFHSPSLPGSRPGRGPRPGGLRLQLPPRSFPTPGTPDWVICDDNAGVRHTGCMFCCFGLHREPSPTPKSLQIVSIGSKRASGVERGMIPPQHRRTSVPAGAESGSRKYPACEPSEESEGPTPQPINRSAGRSAPGRQCGVFTIEAQRAQRREKQSDSTRPGDLRISVVHHLRKPLIRSC
jgi:hypothetical protein